MHRARVRSLPAALAVVTAASVAARLVALGARPAHWDEARVAFWTLEYAATGAWSYHPVLHGPFLFHVNRVVFGTLGASDATARLVVAAIGGALPLSAWLFRRHLSDRETIALAALLAATPLLVYYSRFMRNDVPLAAFMLVGFGFLVRTRDTGRARYGLAAAAAIGLGSTTKENAVLYGLAWIGAVALYVLARDRPSPRSSLGRAPRVARAWLDRWWPVALAGAVVWFVIVVAAYAPRTGATGGIGLGGLITAPSAAPAVVGAATVGAAGELVSYWVLDGASGVGVRTPLYLAHLIGVSLVGALGVAALAPLGAIADARSDRPRALVSIATRWGGLSLVGYPVATDFAAPWIAVHVVIPLAIPAAVGLVAVSDRAMAIDATAGRRRQAAVLGLLVLGAQTAGVGFAATYAAPAHPFNPLAQPAQASGELAGTVDAIEAAACGRSAPRVLYYGEYFRPGTIARRLPLAWYVAAAGITATFASTPGGLPAEPPPVVIALDASRGVLDPRLPGYGAVEHELDPWVPREPHPAFTEAVVYLDRDAPTGQCR